MSEGFKILTDKDDEYILVENLISKFEEFKFLNFSNILCILNTKKKVNEELVDKGEAKFITLSKINQKISDIIYELTQNRYDFILEFFKSELDLVDINQIKAVLYFELRKISNEYKIKETCSNDWIKIIHGIGKDYRIPSSSCTDILDTNFTWKKCLGEYYNQLADENN